MTRHTSKIADVLIAGGGPAGVCAALAAARERAHVVLCQDRSVLGGNASSEIRMHVVGADSNGYRCGFPLEVEARESGVIEEIRLLQAVTNPARSPHLLDLCLYDLVRREERIELLLDTCVVDAQVNDRRITAVRALRESTEEEFTIAAKMFVDCSGDSRMAVAAGNPYRTGREAKAEFGEPHAQDAADHYKLGSTVLFQARDLGRPVPFTAPPWARKFTEADLRNRAHASGEAGGEKSGLGYGYWWIEWGGHLDTISDAETIRKELLAIALGIWDHLKNAGDHAAENWALTWVGMLPGKRESRRLVGRHTLTELDVIEARDFADAIAYGGWFIDLHPPLGVDQPEDPPCIQIPVPHLYPIPLACCCSQTIENLMFAGRNISATHVAFASTRVMATCAVVGQGVGTAAAYAAKNQLTIPALYEDGRHIEAIQQAILRQDGFLISVENQDPADLARRATVTASSEQPAGLARNVIDGQTRSVHGDRGAKPGAAKPGTHRWMSDPEQGLPATLMLNWPQPVEISEVQLTFDTGLHRFLTLTQNDAVHERNIWGPQPEIVRDYELIGIAESGAETRLATLTGNSLRLRRHRFAAVRLRGLRIIVRATNGLDHARLVEIRCYASQ
ncbi:MAG: FAD-dependent oxidoreductase [Planctomycetes bacterium]|nr:FAD-dependent oxidoreductase [Planctomycetota bacterium]